MFGNCCCGVLSVRQGVFAFGMLCILSGFGELFSMRFLGLIEIAVGVLGCNAAYDNKNVDYAKYNLIALAASFFIRVSL